MLHFCEILPSPHSLGNGYGWNTRTTPSTTRLTYDACLPVCLKKMQKRRRHGRLHHQEASDRFSRRTLRALCPSVWTVTSLLSAALLWTSLEVRILISIGANKYYWHFPPLAPPAHAAEKGLCSNGRLLSLLLLFLYLFYFVLGHIHFKRCSQRDWHNGGETKHKFLISWLSSCLSDVLESSCMATPKAVRSICIIYFLCLTWKH